MRLLVCGSRDFPNSVDVHEAIVAQHNATPLSCIIEGGAAGADTFAASTARTLGIDLITVKADWTAHGKSAGPLRNTKMLALKPDLVMAFTWTKDPSPGTANMISQARSAGVPIHHYYYELRCVRQK